MNREMCVSANSLAIGDETESATPQVGDEVEFTVTGKVSRAEGGNVYVTPSTINGSPVEATEGSEDAAFESEMENMLNERSNPTTI